MIDLSDPRHRIDLVDMRRFFGGIGITLVLVIKVDARLVDIILQSGRTVVVDLCLFDITVRNIFCDNIVIFAGFCNGSVTFGQRFPLFFDPLIGCIYRYSS